jgi:hypothetical protein
VGPNAALTSEAVIAYPTVAAASVDFARHHDWQAGCGAAFSWTDMPHAQAVAPLALNSGPSRAFGYRAAMYAPDRSPAAPGSQGFVYIAIQQRGNAIAILTTSSASAAMVTDPADPGPSWITSATTALSGLLATAYPAS